IETLRIQPGETLLVMGQGPIGIILAILAKKAGARVIASDLYPQRLRMVGAFGLVDTLDASQTDPLQAVRERTEGRGADAVVVAAAGNTLIQRALDAARPGGRVLLFAQTVRGEAAFDPASICVDEKTLLGSYSASVDLQDEAVRFVFKREADLERLISHRFALSEVVAALELAAHPQPDSMKIVIQPGAAPTGSGQPKEGRRL
ncbi:MAG: zinc-binding dehydrogenase, partial [Terriglobales bacterium]